MELNPKDGAVETGGGRWENRTHLSEHRWRVEVKGFSELQARLQIAGPQRVAFPALSSGREGSPMEGPERGQVHAGTRHWCVGFGRDCDVLV